MGSLPKKQQKFTPENGCLEYEAVSFWGARLGLFSGGEVAVSFREGKS